MEQGGDTTGRKTILVTGGAGFVGSHLCERLAKDGHRVISLDNYFTGSRTNHVSGVEYREGHTKDIDSHVPEKPEIVYHLGEYARTEKSFEDIELVWDLNKSGTFAVLEFCRRRKCKIVYAGSSTKFADDGAGRDQSPYAWTKATNTELVKNYAEWFGIDYAIAYFYNVYGPREMSGMYGTLIQIFSEEYRHGQPLTVVAPGTQRRNFTYVGDIVEGLVLTGLKGSGDGYGIGNDQSYSVLEVADLFKGEQSDIVMLPERKGNRQMAGVDNARVKALGWSARTELADYVRLFKEQTTPEAPKEQRVLVFSTTFHPVAGKAEDALCLLMSSMPHTHFDIVTTRFTKDADRATCPVANATIHRVGRGTSFDKYLLPFLGRRVARRLAQKHQYLFTWALFASYAAFAAVLSRKSTKVPFLITLADQKLSSVPFHIRILMRLILGEADQVYASDLRQEKQVATLARRTKRVRSLGKGDAFANQIRFAYSGFLNKLLTS